MDVVDFLIDGDAGIKLTKDYHRPTDRKPSIIRGENDVSTKPCDFGFYDPDGGLHLFKITNMPKFTDLITQIKALEPA